MHKTLLILSFALFLLPSCGRNNASVNSRGTPVEFSYAENIAMESHDGFTTVRIRNPWDTTKLLHTYILLEEGGSAPADAAGADVIKVPLKSSVVYSCVHIGLADDLGALDAITGVCDKQYIYQENIRKRIADGSIADCGNSMEPNVEKMLMLRPGAVLLSPYESTNSYGKLDKAGIPVVECADYMEKSPLARAEWMKFFGRLYGKARVADSLFNATEREYNRLKALVADTKHRPTVMTDRIYGQIWDVAGGRSTTGTFIEDAGGRNIFGDNNKAGSLQLSPEKVLMQARDADVWLIRANDGELTLESLGAEREIYSHFKAFRQGNVYASYASRCHIFEDQAFHPQWILADLIRVLHPENSAVRPGRAYYEQLK